MSERAWRSIDGLGHKSTCRLKAIGFVPPPPSDRRETTPPRIERSARRWCLVVCGRVVKPYIGWRRPAGTGRGGGLGGIEQGGSGRE